MESPFTSTLTYTRKFGDAPDSDVKIEELEPFVVEFRPLDAGDRAAIRDSLAMEVSEDESVSLEARLGTIELLTVERAVVSWTLTPAPTREVLRRLRPDVLEALREATSFGRAPAPKPAQEADEAAERQRAALEADELRGDEQAGRVPLASSAGDAGDGS